MNKCCEVWRDAGALGAMFTVGTDGNYHSLAPRSWFFCPTCGKRFPYSMSSRDVRPWTPVEAVGRVVRPKRGMADGSHLIIEYAAGEVTVAGRGSISLKGLLCDYVQADGSPCGVREEK